MYEALGLCGEGQGGRLIDEAKWVKNAAGWQYLQYTIDILYNRRSNYKQTLTNSCCQVEKCVF